MTTSSVEQLRTLKIEDHLRFATEVVDRSALPKSVQDQLRQQIRRIQTRYSDPDLYLAVIGEFSSGKSTFINALLRDALLPTSALITTATATTIRHGNYLSVEARFRERRGGGQTRSIKLKGEEERVTAKRPPGVYQMKTREFIRAVTSDDRVASSVTDVTITHPDSFLADHVVIIDTPGTNTLNPEHEQITRQALQEEADAAIVIIPATTPLSQSLINFLTGPLRPFLDRCLFVVTKMSLIDDSQQDDLLENLRARLARSLEIEPPVLYPCSPQVVTDDLHSETPEQIRIWKERFAELESVISQRLHHERFLTISEHVLRLLDELFERLDTHLRKRWDKYEARRAALERETIQDLPSFAAEQRKACDKMLTRAFSTTPSSLTYIVRTHREKTISAIEKAIFDAQSTETLNDFVQDKAKNLLERDQKLIRKEVQQEFKKLQTKSANVGSYFDAEFSEAYRRLQVLGGQLNKSSKHDIMGQTGASDLVSSMQSSWEVLGEELGEQQGARMGVGMVAGAAIGTFFAPVIGSIVGAAVGTFLGSLFGPSLDERKQKYWDGLTPALDEYFAQLEEQTQTALKLYKKETRAALKEHINSHVTRYKEVAEGMRQKQANELRELQTLQNGVKQDLSGISRRRKTLKTKRKSLVKSAQP